MALAKVISLIAAEVRHEEKDRKADVIAALAVVAEIVEALDERISALTARVEQLENP